MKHFSLTLTLVAVVLLAAGLARAQVGPVFSLDDNPAMPMTSPPGPIPGFGAEDPYGMMLIPPPGFAPSPSLPAVGAMDQDLLVPGPPAGVPVPMMHLPVPGPGYLDAVTDNAFKINPAPMIHLGFSVDRLSMGIAGAAAVESAFNQQSGDIYHTDQPFIHPAAFVGMPPMGPGYNGPLPTVGMGMSNQMLYDESQLGLTVVGGPGIPVPPGVPVAPPFPASHDNVDALNWKLFDVNGDFLQDRWMYLSTPPDAAIMGPWMAGDVLDVAPGGALFPAMPPYAPAGQLGLVPGPFGPGGPPSDCIDALVVWDDGMQGGPAWGGPGAEPMLDYALFSLAPGSTSLWMAGLTEADIFFTNFTGSFWLYASAADLGLMGIPGPAIGANVDALEMMHPGDANLDYCVDGLDYVIWSNNYLPVGAATDWLRGDFTGDGLTDGLDYVVWSNNSSFGCPAAPTAVPEPASALVLTLGLFFIRRRSRA